MRLPSCILYQFNLKRSLHDENTLKRLVSITALLSVSGAFADVIPYIASSSQEFNAARELVGWQC